MAWLTTGEHGEQMSDDDDYDAADSGAANCTPLAAGDARKGGFILIKGKPCKIIDCSKAKVCLSPLNTEP